MKRILFILFILFMLFMVSLVSACPEGFICSEPVFTSPAVTPIDSPLFSFKVISLDCWAISNSSLELCEDGWVINEVGYLLVHLSDVAFWSVSENPALRENALFWMDLVSEYVSFVYETRGE